MRERVPADSPSNQMAQGRPRNRHGPKMWKDGKEFLIHGAGQDRYGHEQASAYKDKLQQIS